MSKITYSVIIITIFMSFMCGSIPTGYLLVKKIKGIDIRSFGSGNIGSTNVKRAAGRGISLITQVLDMFKGGIPVLVGILTWNYIKLPISKDVFLSLIGLAAIFGHNYTPFLGFKGGKGVNTTIGAFAILAFVPTLCGAIVYGVLKLFTNIVSIKSIAFALTICIGCIITQRPLPITIAAVVSCILLIARHKENIKRLVRGEEKGI